MNPNTNIPKDEEEYIFATSQKDKINRRILHNRPSNQKLYAIPACIKNTLRDLSRRTDEYEPSIHDTLGFDVYRYNCGSFKFLHDRQHCFTPKQTQSFAIIKQKMKQIVNDDTYDHYFQ